jgi:hypothetical protein
MIDQRTGKEIVSPADRLVGEDSAAEKSPSEWTPMSVKIVNGTATQEELDSLLQPRPES